MAQLAPEPAQELAHVTLIGLERLVGASALLRQVGEPRLDRFSQVVPQRQPAVVQNFREGRDAHGLVREERFGNIAAPT